MMMEVVVEVVMVEAGCQLKAVDVLSNYKCIRGLLC